MEVSKDKITQLYSKYPQYRLYKTDEFLKVMVEKGELTPEEAELISQPSLFKFDLSDNCGLQLEYSCPKKYHPDFPDIELDSKGYVKTELFEPDKLKVYWEARGCKVEEKNDEFGHHIDIINDKTKERITYNFSDTYFGKNVYINKTNGDNNVSVNINYETQSIDSYSEYVKADDVLFGFKTIKSVNYINNKPAFIIKGDNAKISSSYMNSFIQKISAFNKKNGSAGIIDITNTLIEVPLLWSNAFLEQYKKETGVTLLDATADYPDLYEFVKGFSNNAKVFKSTPQELAHIIDDELSKKEPDSNLVYIALTSSMEKLVDSMEEYDKIQQEKLEKRNSFIDKLSEYLYFKPKEEFSLLEKGETMKGLLDNVISSNINSDTKGYIVDAFFKNVLHEDSMTMTLGDPQKTEDGITKLLKSTNWSEAVKKIYEDKYKEDIEKDIASNSNDIDKVIVSVMRLRNRGNSVKSFFNTTQNGKIDNIYGQGYTGDCWLLAGITSILYKEGGKEYLESLLDYDPITGNVKVNLKGVNKEYTVTADEIKNSNHLAVGDFDIRAFEIAVDKYMRDSYIDDKDFDSENISSEVDIEGNWDSAAFRILIGNVIPAQIYKKDMYKDFNNKHKVYTCGFQKNISLSDKSIYDNVKVEVVTNTESSYSEGYYYWPNRHATEPKNGLIDLHEYSIVGSDEEYVFIKNPWYPDITLKISVEDFEKLNPLIGCADFNIS